MVVSDIESRSPARRIGLGSVVLLLAAFGLWIAIYLAGIWPWLGVAWLTRSSFGAGPLSVVGESKAGSEVGLRTFIFLRGQEIVIEYDATIKAGSLWLYVYEPLKTGQGAGASHYVTGSGSGIWKFSVPATGVYKIVIKPSTARGSGRGWDLSYEVWWGARPAT